MAAVHPLKMFNYCPKCGNTSLTVQYGKAIKCNNCNFEYFFNASGAVIAVIINEQDELLVTRRAFEPAKGELDLPGGFIDADETAEETLVREIKEELNLDIVERQFLFTNHNRYPYSGMIVFTVDLVFLCAVKDFAAIEANDDVTEYMFVPKGELKKGMFGLKSCNEVLVKMGLV